MPGERMNVRVFRLDPLVDKKAFYKTYEVPFEEGMSAMNALDYIYQNLDSTLAYYDHAGCSLGICGRCTGKINGKAGLFCQTRIQGDTTLEPLSESRVLKDLVLEKREGVQAETSESAEGVGAGPHDIGSVPILLRREIEALIAAPLIKAFIGEFGRERTLAVTRRVIASLAHESGKLLAVVAGGNTLEDFKKAMPLFSQGGALEFEMLETSEAQAAFNVTRCRYAEMYKEHGLEEFGYLLSCGRDFALIQGFNPKIKLARTQTIMEGAQYCDFRFSFEGE
jgi:fumarate reductase iron-sulfur subunit